jgi:hypothetical protein
VVTNPPLSTNSAALRHRKAQEMEVTKGFVAITISQEQFFRFQFGTVTALVVLSGFHYSYSYAMGPDLIARFTSIFDVGRENSLPTMFAAMNLLMASVLSFLLYRHCSFSSL